MQPFKLLAATALLTGVAASALAQDFRRERPWGGPAPKEAGACGVPSSEDRIAILEALRGPVSSDLKTDVEIVVQRSRVCGDWAFVLGAPQKEGGEPIDWSQTVCSGDTSHLVGGLAHRDGMAWSLTDYALCPSDVAWADWPEKHNAPQELFDE
jgi:hypothetical protein